LYIIENEEEKLITDVVIPPSILSVPSYAFFRYMPLKTVSIHKDVESIGAQAFIAAPNLEDVSIDQENLLFIKIQGILMPTSKNTIYGVEKGYVGEIELSEELLEVPAYCFYQRSNITKIVIPETVTNIGEYAFYSCSSLTYVNLPEELSTLGNYAFYNCVALE
jgi:hypothetical protein